MLTDLLRANEQFRAQKHLDPSSQPFTGPARQLALVSCMDSRLVTLLPPALGLGRGDAVWIRNAGNTITRTDDSILRSVAAAVYIQGVRHVAVVGHTDCRMAQGTTAIFQGMQQAGVPQEAFGDRDPREWFGTFASIDENVRAVIAALVKTPVLPSGIPVCGLIVDSDTGEARGICEEVTKGWVKA